MVVGVFGVCVVGVVDIGGVFGGVFGGGGVFVFFSHPFCCSGTVGKSNGSWHIFSGLVAQFFFRMTVAIV